MKTTAQVYAELVGTPFEGREIFRIDRSQLNPSLLIVIFVDGVQTNVPA